MPKSRGPRKPYRGPQYERDLASLQHNGSSETPAEVRRERVQGTPAPDIKINKPAIKPSAHGRLLPIAVGAGLVGGGAYLLHRHRRNQVRKIYDPYTDTVYTVEKSDAEPVISRVSLTHVRNPRGQFVGTHVSHANDLSVTYHHPKRSLRSDLQVIRRRQRRNPSQLSGVGKSIGSSSPRHGYNIEKGLFGRGAKKVAETAGRSLEDATRGYKARGITAEPTGRVNAEVTRARRTRGVGQRIETPKRSVPYRRVLDDTTGVY